MNLDRSRRSTIRRCQRIVMILCGVVHGCAAIAQQAFPTPEAAVAALRATLTTTNSSDWAKLLGPDLNELVNPDPVQAREELAEFTAAFNQTHRIVPATKTRAILEVGPKNWPMPIPLVKRDEGWVFDTAAGREELLNRRIGRNELMALEAVRAYVGAQREYASRDRDGDEVLEYAQNLVSTPGQKDGLYWDPELDGSISPLGPEYAHAQAEADLSNPSGKQTEPAPFRGYFYKILTRQGKRVPGGKYDYVINGNMIGGFALVAYPAGYGTSGIMTFIINQQGRVYQKDLGPKTASIVRRMKSYEPDSSWKLSPD